MLTREAVAKGLKEFADLIFISFSPREHYDCFIEVKGRTGCRFIICELIIFGDVPWELLSEEIPLQTLVHISIQPHVDEPPWASQDAEGFTKQKPLSYLVKEMICGTQEVSAKGESDTIG